MIYGMFFYWIGGFYSRAVIKNRTGFFLPGFVRFCSVMPGAGVVIWPGFFLPGLVRFCSVMPGAGVALCPVFNGLGSYSPALCPSYP